MIVQKSAVQRDQWQSFLCYLRDGETIFPLPRLNFIMNSIKMCMYQWNRSVQSLQRDVGSTLLRLIF